MTAKIDTGTTIATVFVELSPNFPFAVVSNGISGCVFKLVFGGGGV